MKATNGNTLCLALDGGLQEWEWDGEAKGWRNIRCGLCGHLNAECIGHTKEECDADARRYYSLLDSERMRGIDVRHGGSDEEISSVLSRLQSNDRPPLGSPSRSGVRRDPFNSTDRRSANGSLSDSV